MTSGCVIVTQFYKNISVQNNYLVAGSGVGLNCFCTTELNFLITLSLTFTTHHKVFENTIELGYNVMKRTEYFV
jgi:hypothetical protein